jgi:hypothetical protein
MYCPSDGNGSRGLALRKLGPELRSLRPGLPEASGAQPKPLPPGRASLACGPTRRRACGPSQLKPRYGPAQAHVAGAVRSWGGASTVTRVDLGRIVPGIFPPRSHWQPGSLAGTC